ncbi:MAG: molybdopterin-dependent oxidoreductase, partial [Planctomycetes bacterium]|nr:molybdopterin-dependent oxidoreductase [Planctomycetota bacterium]
AEYADEPRKRRQPNPLVPVAQRLRGFEPVELGFDERAARREADRCLACGCIDYHECTLRKLATEYGARPERLAGARRQEPVDDRHPLLVRDPSKCILCGRCVRACVELAGVGVLGFVNRGFEARIEPEFGLPLDRTDCTACGLCVGACPTGALTAKMALPKPGRWKTVPTLTTCGYCGVGCTVELQRKGRRLVRASAPFEAPVNQGSLCARGLFGWQQAHSKRRIRAPMVRSQGRLWETSWDDALDAIVQGVRRALEGGGPGDVAVLVAPWWTNEAMWLTKRLAEDVLETKNVLALSPSVVSESAARFRSDGRYQDLDEADAVVLVGVELTSRYPVLAVRLRQALRGGVQVMSVGRQETGVEDVTSAAFRPRADEPVSALLKVLVRRRRSANARAL